MKKWKSFGAFYRKTAVVLAATFLVVLVCLIQLFLPSKQYTFTGSCVFETGAAGIKAVYEGIALPAGVYEVTLDYDTDTDLQSICRVQDGTVFEGGLLTNGEHLYSGLERTDFRFWLFEDTKELQVVVEYGGNGSLRTGDLLIRNTKQLFSMLMVITLALSLALIGIFIWQECDRKGKLLAQQRSVVVLLGAVALIASLPYLSGVSINGADLTYHLQRIEGVKDGLLSGQFPVRLEPEWVYGHGYANGIFYCNILLIVPALLRLAGFPVTDSYNVYCIALNVATVWIAYYCFYKIFRDRMIGVACSALYTLSVFRIYKLVITAAVGEGSAVTFMPLVFYGLYRVFTEDVKAKEYKTAWVPIAVGYAGLMQTHVLTCEITAFLTILICAVMIRRVFVRETFVELIKGALGAVVMSLWYLVPFLDYYLHEDVHIKHVSARTIQDRGIYPAQLAFHFWKYGSNALQGEEGMRHSHALGVGFVLVLGFAVFGILWFHGKWKKDKIARLGKVSMVFGGMLMLMSLSIFPWDRIQSFHPITASLVSSLQFPNRFLGWGTVFLVTIAGCCLWYFRDRQQKWGYYMGIVLVGICITTSGMYLIDYLCRDNDSYRLYNEESMGFGYISGAEYLIEGTKEELLTFKGPTAGENVVIGSYEKEYLHVLTECENTGEQEGYIELPLLHYKGYRAFVQDSGEELSAVKGTNHVVRVILPPGFKGMVEVRFVSPLAWRLAEAVSWIGYLGMAVWVFGRWRRRRKGRVSLYA